MKRKHLRRLWFSRFERMYAVESGILGHYRRILQRSPQLRKSAKVTERMKRYLSEIAQDEKKHVDLVKKLFEILDRQPD